MELKGSKTEKNLWYAFAGESQARNKYDYFASKAKKEGFEQIAAIFQETALNEKEHAKLWFKALDGISDTRANLLAAAAGEHEEWTDMYKRFAEEAKEEGFEELAFSSPKWPRLKLTTKSATVSSSRTLKKAKFGFVSAKTVGNAATAVQSSRVKQLLKNAPSALIPRLTSSLKPTTSDKANKGLKKTPSPKRGCFFISCNYRRSDVFKIEREQKFRIGLCFL